MDCNRVQALLHGYIDDELDLVSALEVEEHLKGCRSCSLEYDQVRELRSVIAQNNAALVYPAPEAMRKRIQTSLRKTQPAKRSLPRLQWGWVGVALLVSTFLFIIAGYASGWLFPRPDTRLVAEVDTAHIRSLMANHLTDVFSTDQHTVKPWFDGKLDFSPPVVNLAGQGYPLVGGRLDYLDGHPVAALVYMRNKHVINLFIWPTAARDSAILGSTHNGYNLYEWNQAGMAYWAVSDLNSSELKDFVGLIQQELK